MDERARVLLRRYTAAPHDATLDWDDVLVRAGIVVAPVRDEPKTGVASSVGGLRRRRALVVALVFAGLVVIVATALGATFGRPLVTYLGQQIVGGPVAPKAQRAFSQAQKRGWTDFPAGVELRQLVTERVDGSTFTLGGFRVGDSLCLRVTVSGRARGSDESCAPRAQLEAQQQPAVVVLADDGFGTLPTKPVKIGPDIYTHSVLADVTVGIVADGVKRVTVAGEGRTQHAVIADNAFLVIVDRPQVGFRIQDVWATTSGKRRIAIPFAPAPFAGLNTVARSGRKALGPAKVQRIVNGGGIGWLEHHQPRGAPVPARDRPGRGWPYLHRVVFDRLITPDPNSPLKQVVSIELRQLAPDEKPVEVVCDTLLAYQGGGGGCDRARSLFAHGQLSTGQEIGNGGDQYETISGLASDTVKRVELFLATGERIAVPLKDNVFIVEAERSSFPARLVAYDKANEIIEVQTFQSDGESGPHLGPVAGAKWETLIKATSASGVTAQMLIAPKIGGGTCWAFREGTDGAGGSGCLPKRWRGPAINLGFYEASPGTGRHPAFVTGQARPGITSITIERAGKPLLTLKVTHGLLLAALPPGYTPTQNEYAVGFNKKQKQVARTKLPSY